MEPSPPRRGLRALLAFSGASARQLLTRGKLLFTEDPGQSNEQKAELSAALALVRSAGEMKAGVAKAAQLSGYLAGLGDLPDAMAYQESRAVLASLFDHIPGGEPAAIRQVVREELGKEPEDLFTTWDDRPFAAASLGEVHGATAPSPAGPGATAAGTTAGAPPLDLAVKVQYPGIDAALRADLDNDAVLRRLTGAAMGGAVSKQAQDAVKAAILREVDYRAEGESLSRFRAAFLNDPHIVVPRYHPALSARRVLTADRLRGSSLPAFCRDAPAAARAAAAATLFRFALASPLQHGLLNADPNPGNYLMLDDASGARVGFLDFGCAVELPEDVVTCERVLWASLLAGEGETLRYALYREGMVSEMIELDSDRYRRWERCLLLPFRTHDFTWTAAYAREFVDTTSLLVRGKRFTLPATSILLWRQRLGVAAVLGQLGGRADYRRVLMDVLRAVDLLPAGVR